MKISERQAKYKVARAVRSGAARVADRVTVRLKPELAARLASAKQEGQSVTQIIEAALEKHLPETRRKPKLTLLEAFRKHGLLGTVDMPPDASVNYKKYIGEYLERKHGYR